MPSDSTPTTRHGVPYMEPVDEPRCAGTSGVGKWLTRAEIDQLRLRSEHISDETAAKLKEDAICREIGGFRW